MSDANRLSPYRWLIELLILLTLLVQSLAWLAPAPLLEPISKSLNISLASAGGIISIIALCIAIFSMAGAVVMEKLGIMRALLVGIWLMAIAQILSGYSASFAQLLFWRVLEGVGYGVLIAPPGALVMQWFGEHEWPYINMISALFGYVGLFAVFQLTAPLYLAVGSSWLVVLRDYGLISAVVALAWTIFGRERRTQIAEAATAGAAGDRSGSALGEVAKRREILLIAAGLFGGMWVFQLYTAFLPTYFSTFRGLGLAEASSMTSVLPLTGIFAALGGGMGTGMTGLRKPFLWPVAICTFFGCLGAIMFPDPMLIRASLVLVGIGAAGSLAAVTTLVMELPGMTPEKMGVALAFVWSVGYAGAFVSPIVGGALAASIGLRNVMMFFLVFQFLPIVCMYLLPETGKGRTTSARTVTAAAG
ncbi:MAG TPA: MFS transporter [Candidatus Binataceae bacterium]|nr:MFS transporter [Candidatus Binataceae bacterium]